MPGSVTFVCVYTLSFNLQNLCGIILISQRRRLRLEKAENFTVLGDCKTLAKVSWNKLRNKKQQSKTWRSKHVENQRPNEHVEVPSQHLTCPRPQLVSREGGIWTLIRVAPKPKLLTITLPCPYSSSFFSEIMAKQGTLQSKFHPFKSWFTKGDFNYCHELED